MKVVRTSGGVVQMVQVCAVMFGYIFASSSAEYENGALASVFRKVSFAGAHNAVNCSRVIMRKEESESGLMSSIT